MPDIPGAGSMVDPVGENVILLHIGTHKTGTTALQAILAAARPALAEHGIRYPGRAEHHHRPARALRRLPVPGGGAPPIRAWTRFAAEVRAHRGRVVISSEFFAALDNEGRARLARDLGPERLHVVVAVRHPAKRAPSWWQQTLKQGQSADFDRWLERRWRSEVPVETYDAAVVRHWSASVGASNLTVIVIDDKDERLLPRTFEQLLNLEPGTLADRRPRVRNRGMTAQEAEFVRRANAALHGKIDPAQYDGLVRNGLIRRLVEARVPGDGEPTLRLPPWAMDVSLALGERLAAALEASGARVVGDTNYLRSPIAQPAALDQAQRHVVPISAAVEAVVGVIGPATTGTWDIERARGPATYPATVSKASALASKVRARVRRRWPRRANR